MKPLPLRHLTIYTLLLFIVMTFAPTDVILAQEIESSPREIMRLGRGTANTLAWRPDGEVLAVGSATGIWLFDENFALLAHLAEPTQGTTNVYSIQWSPDGTRLAVMYREWFSNDLSAGTTEIWQISETGAIGDGILSIPHTGHSIAWSPNGDKLAFAMGVEGIEMRDVNSGELLWHIDDSAYSLTWSPDSRKLATNHQTQESEKVRLWDVQTGEYIGALSADSDVYCEHVAWSSQNNLLACGDSDGGFFLWDVSAPHSARTIKLYDDSEYPQVIWNGDSTKLLVIINRLGQSATVIDAVTWEKIAVVDYAATSRLHLATWKGNSELTVINDSALETYNTQNGELSQRSARLFNSYVVDATFSPDSQQLSAIYGSLSGYSSAIWDISKRDAMYEPQVTFPINEADAVMWSSEGIVTYEDRLGDSRTSTFSQIQQWDTLNGEQLGNPFNFDFPRGESDIVWSDDFQRIAYVSESHEFTSVIHVLERGTPIATINKENRVFTMAFSQDAQQLTTISYNANYDFVVQVWNLENAEVVSVYTFEPFDEGQHNRSIAEDIVWSPNGLKYAIVSPERRHIDIVHAATGHRGIRFDAYGLIEAKWSPDSQLIAIYDAPAGIFDASSGKWMETLPLFFTSMDWSSDGTKLALGMQDGTIRIWDVSDLTQN